MSQAYDNDQQTRLLSTLAAAPSAAVCEFVDELLPRLPEVKVEDNRTGLVMVPYTDTRKGTRFHLGEALVAEARITLGDCTGYGATLGADTRHALAIAILDAACTGEHCLNEIFAFVSEQVAAQQEAEQNLLKKVEATRVEMETY